MNAYAFVIKPDPNAAASPQPGRPANPERHVRYAGKVYWAGDIVPFSQEDIAAGVPEQYGHDVFRRINLAGLVVAPRKSVQYKPPVRVTKDNFLSNRTPKATTYLPGESVPFTEAEIASGEPLRLLFQGVLIDPEFHQELGGTYRAPQLPQPGAGPAAFINAEPGRSFGKGPGAVLDAQNVPVVGSNNRQGVL